MKLRNAVIHLLICTLAISAGACGWGVALWVTLQTQSIHDESLSERVGTSVWLGALLFTTAAVWVVARSRQLLRRYHDDDDKPNARGDSSGDEN